MSTVSGRLDQSVEGAGKRRIFVIGNYVNQRLFLSGSPYDGLAEEESSMGLGRSMPRSLWSFEGGGDARACTSLPSQTTPRALRCVQTDASDFAIGGVLMQEGHPISYESRKLNDTERRYTIQDKEMTAGVHCLRTWRHYLLGANQVLSSAAAKPVVVQLRSESRYTRFRYEFVRPFINRKRKGAGSPLHHRKGEVPNLIGEWSKGWKDRQR